MTKEQLKTLVDFISATASKVVCNDIGLEGYSETASFAWSAEKDLYKSFGFDRLEEDL